MKRLLPIAAAALLLVGCGSNPEVPAESSTVETTATTTYSSTTSATTSAEPTSTTSAPAPEPTTPQAEATHEEPAQVEQSAQPYIVECFGVAPGIQSRMSDGSVIYTDYCFNQLGGPQYLEQERWANSPENPALAEYYENLEQQAPVEQTPSPWVQGQLDWVNCLDAGNSEEYCRETLN